MSFGKGVLKVILPLLLIGGAMSAFGYAQMKTSEYKNLSEEKGYVEYIATTKLKTKSNDAFTPNTYTINFNDEEKRVRETIYKTLELIPDGSNISVKYNRVENISVTPYPSFETTWLIGISVIVALLGIALEVKAFAPTEKGSKELPDINNGPIYTPKEANLPVDDNDISEKIYNDEPIPEAEKATDSAIVAEGEEYLLQESNVEDTENENNVDQPSENTSGNEEEGSIFDE